MVESLTNLTRQWPYALTVGAPPTSPAAVTEPAELQIHSGPGQRLLKISGRAPGPTGLSVFKRAVLGNFFRPAICHRNQIYFAGGDRCGFPIDWIDLAVAEKNIPRIELAMNNGWCFS